MTTNSVKNCSTIFLLPGVGHLRQDLIMYGFIGAYLDDINHEVHYEESLYLLFKPEKLKDFQKFLDQEYEKNPLILEDYDYRGGYVVIVYKFEERFLPEYQLFFEGKYSEFSKEYISFFPTHIMIDMDGVPILKCSLHYHIFNRTSEMKQYWERKTGEIIPPDMELWSKPDMEKEILDIKTFQN